MPPSLASEFDEMRDAVRDVGSTAPISISPSFVSRLLDRHDGSLPTSKAVLNALKALKDRVGEVETERDALRRSTNSALSNVQDELRLATRQIAQQQAEIAEKNGFINALKDRSDQALANLAIANKKIDELKSETSLIKSLARRQRQRKENIVLDDIPLKRPEGVRTPVVIPSTTPPSDALPQVEQLSAIVDRLLLKTILRKDNHTRLLEIDQ
uniref:Uncharacterized protein n=1 Tax=Spongospora subterranea TaxID=70186 RepID=A0A0H5QMN9_9EUKA|eukprot:CRZ03262.1 hypothetical protein [Spongospora subterranea]